jgi:hypothetical protein
MRKEGIKLSLFKHHGRRLAAIGVGVTLLVLGLQATAQAVPTVSAVAPGSGPTTCAVVITGTGFLDFPQAQQDLTFVGPAAGAGDDVAVTDANWFAISDTEIWASVPVLVPGTTYMVQVTDPTGGVPAGTFLSTTGAGACAPTITGFTPACGEAGTVVTITGTNLLGPDLAGGEVRFNPYSNSEIATHSVPDVDEPTSLSVIVPTTAADGKIQVTTFATAGGTVFSDALFQVPPPDCPPPGAAGHPRSITLALKKHLVAKGKVTSTEDPAFTECAAGVPVKIQRRKSGHWKNVGSTTTSDTGAYKVKIKDKPGKYRAKAPKVDVGEPAETCAPAKSATRKHSH